MGFAAGDYNLSRYVFGGPTNWIDPSGLFVETAASTAAGATAVTEGAATTTGGSILSGLLVPFTIAGGIILGTAQPVADGTLKGARRIINGSRKISTTPLPSPSSLPTQSPSPSPSTAPNPQPSNPNCQQQPQKKPCSGLILGGTYNQVSYSNRGTGSTPHHMPGFAAIEASGIALGQNRNYYYTKTPTTCMSSIDHKLTDSFQHTVKSIAYVKIFSQHIKTHGFYDAQLEDVKEIKYKFPGKYDQGIVQMQNHTLNLIATEPHLFK
jgi:hypothetical protein